MSKKIGDAAQKLITVNGETLNITGWAKKTGLSKQVISKRLKAGWKPSDAVLRSTVERVLDEGASGSTR